MSSGKVVKVAGNGRGVSEGTKHKEVTTKEAKMKFRTWKDRFEETVKDAVRAYKNGEKVRISFMSGDVSIEGKESSEATSFEL